MGSLALGAWLAGPGQVAIVFPLIAFTLSGVAFMWTWPTALALVSRRAPKKINALMMAVVYLSAFVSGVGSGAIAIYYEPLGATAFFALNAVIALSGAVIILLFGPALKRNMDRLDAETA